MVTLFHCWDTRIKTNKKRINTNGHNSVGAYCIRPHIGMKAARTKVRYSKKME